MPVRRMKTYSGDSGVVYQYYFLQSRTRRRLFSRGGTSFLFRVSSDRKTSFVVEVVVEESAAARWEKSHDRPPISSPCWPLCIWTNNLASKIIEVSRKTKRGTKIRPPSIPEAPPVLSLFLFGLGGFLLCFLSCAFHRFHSPFRIKFSFATNVSSTSSLVDS